MKRKLYFLTLFIILQLAAFIVTAEAAVVETLYNGNSYPLISTDGNLPEFVQINGETYLVDSIKNACIQIKDAPEICDVLRQPGYDWDFDGEYYLKRYSAADSNSSFFQRMTFSIYDKEFNYIRESRGFDGYIADVGYYDGTYYCYVTNPRNPDGRGYYTSPDLIKWTKQEKDYIFTDHVGDTAIRNMRDTARHINSKLSIQGSDFYNIAYETESSIYNTRHFGEWLLKEGKDGMYLTSDGVYNVQIADSTVVLEELNSGSSGREYQLYMYEYGDEIIIDRRYI